MAKTKKLTDSQIAALSCLVEGAANYTNLLHAGANGATTSWLFKHGLVIERQVATGKFWEINQAGTAALASGCIVV